jgi:phosphoglycolate phosphatase-like HAD superfamily hydrolase
MIMQYTKALAESFQERGYKVTEESSDSFLVGVGFNAPEFLRFLRDQVITKQIQVLDSADMAMSGYIRLWSRTNEDNQRLLASIDIFRQRYAVAFDLDGTLVDTTNSFDRTIAEIVERYSGQPLNEQELSNLRAEGAFNNDWDALEEILLRRSISIPRPKIEQEASETYFRLAPINEKLMIDFSLLENLAQRHPIYIVTGRSRAEYEPLWGGTFDTLCRKVYCAGDLENCRPKPAPDYLLALLKEGNFINGVYVGNSVDDMSAATLANMRSIGIQSSLLGDVLLRAGAELVLDSPNELARLFLL